MKWAVKVERIGREGAMGLKKSFEQVRHSPGECSPVVDTLEPVPWLKDSTNNHGRKYNDGDNDIEGDGGRSGTGGHKVVRNDGPVGRFSWAGVRKSQRGDLQSRAP